MIGAKRRKAGAPPPTHRRPGRDAATSQVIRRGAAPRGPRDLYHALLTMSWPAMVALTAGAYVTLNLIFACLYLLDPGGVANSRPGNFGDMFFFSVQTMATIGYGALYPKTLYSNIVVSIETVTGLLSFALITGLWFTRFSRPTARVLFSRVAVIAPYEGVPSFAFRMANERRNQILQAEVRVTLVRNEWTREGVEVRRLRDLSLVRDHSAFFGLSWTVAHRIDPSSPLHGETADSLTKTEAQIVVLVAGIDETLNQTIHARYSYGPGDILWQRRLVDILFRDEEGNRVIDLSRFHDTQPLGSSG